MENNINIEENKIIVKASEILKIANSARQEEFCSRQ
jgi:hypothetical protein